MMTDMHYVQYSEKQCYFTKTNYSVLPTMTLQNILIIVFSSKILPHVTILISCGILRKAVQSGINISVYL